MEQCLKLATPNVCRPLCCFEGVTHWHRSNLATAVMLFSFYLIWLVLFACAHSLSKTIYALFYEICRNVKHTVAALVLLTFLKTAKGRNTNTMGLNQLLPSHSSQIISKHKGLSVRLLSITKSPWFVLQACSPRSSASLTPSPSLPDPQPPSCPHWAAKGFWCSHRIHCECERSSQHAKTPQTGSYSSEPSDTLLPCQAACSLVELSPCFY